MLRAIKSWFFEEKEEEKEEKKEEMRPQEEKPKEKERSMAFQTVGKKINGDIKFVPGVTIVSELKKKISEELEIPATRVKTLIVGSEVLLDKDTITSEQCSLFVPLHVVVGPKQALDDSPEPPTTRVPHVR